MSSPVDWPCKVEMGYNEPTTATKLTFFFETGVQRL
jgi:hypothetical protein